jgi:hypothetical protein
VVGSVDDLSPHEVGDAGLLVAGGPTHGHGMARPYAHQAMARDGSYAKYGPVLEGEESLRAGAWTAPAHGLAYDPASNRWSPLPRSPLRGRFGHVAVWTGTKMLIWGGHPSRGDGPERPFTDGAAYTPYPL